VALVVAIHLPLIGRIGYFWGWHGVGRALHLVAILIGLVAPFGLGMEVMNDLRRWWPRART
jgi:hypothetical protein